MRLSVLIGVSIGVAASVRAQGGVDPSKPQISLPQILVQGVVLDKDSREPVPGAQVSTTLMPGPTPGSVTVSGGATSGASGEFQMRLNQSPNLNLVAQAPHYQRGQALVRGITLGQSSVYIEITLVRLQSLGGVLVDDETRKPIAGLAVELIAKGNSTDVMGLGTLPRGTKTVSGTDGRFSFPELPRDEYFLRISDKPEPLIGDIPAKDLEGDGRDKALEPPEGALSYGTIVYPGRNADIPNGPGITVGATPVDVGEIRLTRNRLQSLSGLVAPCEDGAKIHINLTRPSDIPVLGPLTTRDLTCGEGFQLLNLPDGSYTVTAMQGFPQRRWVSQSIDAHTRSPLRLTLNAFVSVEISVEVEGAPPDAMPPAVRFAFEAENQAAKVDAPAVLASGIFEATLYPGERYGLSAAMPAKYYVRRMTYNGSTLPDASGFAASTAPISQLTVVLSDKAATVEVRLTYGGSPPKDRPMVILLRDGMNFTEFNPNSLRNMRPANGTGALSFAGLAPGTYRAAIVAPDQPLPTTKAAFQAMLADASRQSMPVTVDEGQTATITWDVP
jgi:hypothetical protein